VSYLHPIILLLLSLVDCVEISIRYALDETQLLILGMMEIRMGTTGFPWTKIVLNYVYISYDKQRQSGRFANETIAQVMDILCKSDLKSQVTIFLKHRIIYLRCNET
jgi:hypothetical protein